MFRLILSLAASLVLVPLLGCQTGQDVTATDAPWTSFSSQDQMLQFEHPDGMKQTIRSQEPLGFLLTDQGEDFAITVVLASDGDHGEDYLARAIETSLEDATPLGPTRSISLGNASGLRQDYRFRDGTRYRRGTTTVLMTEQGRLVFDVGYAERTGGRFQPVYQRVLDSLRFADQTILTRNVSTSPDEQHID